MPPKPKKKCCVSRPRCKRCPIRLLSEGRLPDGYTVKKRKLVKTKNSKKKTKKKPKPKDLPVAA
ncbi:MAG: hypothetical protein GEU93_13335 [Propionibacteriales bacterium]|nr:hypothetical protein [Propionibacteriales bacterium]